MSDAPSVQMVAHYDDYNGIFEVELWEEGRGYILDLTQDASGRPTVRVRPRKHPMFTGLRTTGRVKTPESHPPPPNRIGANLIVANPSLPW